MFLKSLDINGFKSFCELTRLEFHEGVTGIVGPNGCGKSNVVDAIRWVLGETSAKALRGGEMADVIFNGADKRKPLGMAEVLLTLGDCEGALVTDFNEVCVGRRVYRDGKSEYLLNGTTCRLKDINELFMDTGIGRSSYSVMEQGKIDMLLSSKPEDRRMVFEEAAGITKYKRQKKEALRKLEYTEANLTRIVDVLEEQRRQMNSLQRQAAKARRYATLLEEVTVLDSHLSHRQFVALNAERGELLTSIGSLRIMVKERQEAIEGGQSRVQSTRTAFQAIEQEIAGFRERENALAGRVQAATARIGFNEERESEFCALIGRNETDIASNAEKREAQQRNLFETDENLKVIDERIVAQDVELSRFVEQTEKIRREREEIDAGLRENRDQLGSSKSLVATLMAQLEGGARQLDSTKERILQVSGEASRLREDVQTKKSEAAALATEHGKCEMARVKLETGLKRQEDTLANLRRELEAAREAESSLFRELAEKRTRLETLQQLVASGEGFERGTQEVLKGLDQPEFFKNAIRGVVANFIEVKKEFIPAIEAALGHHLQAVVVADSAMAASMMESLRKGELGQASLIPEDFLAVAADLQMETTPSRSVSWAIDVVKAQPKVQAVIDGLLANVLVVENLSAALDLRREMPTIAFATKSGEFVSPAGILSGGFKEGGAASVLERQSEIRDLEVEVDSLTGELEEQSRQVAGFETQVQVAREEVGSRRERLQQTRIAAATAEGQLGLVKRELDQLKAKLESLAWEEGEMEKRQTEGRERLTELETRKLATLESIQALVGEQGDLENRLTLVQEREAQSGGLLNELRTSLAVEKQAREALRQQRGPMSNRLAELEDILERRKAEILSYEQRITEGQKNTEVLRLEIAESESAISRLAEERKGREAKRGDLLGQIENGDAQLVTLRQEMDQLVAQCGQEEVRSTQLELRLSNLADQIRTRYQVELELFEPDAHLLLTTIAEQREVFRQRGGTKEGMGVALDESEPDWAFVESIMGEQRRKLDSMGPVNLDAIAEFDELEQRFNLMEEQHDDLENSKDELRKVIAKINATTETMFAETFEKVRVNFRGMFTELFGKGAQANLVLLDDEDPLECGIEIIAKPPGKKLQSISLLSGGERSMTPWRCCLQFTWSSRRHFACSTSWTRHWTRPTSSDLCAS